MHAKARSSDTWIKYVIAEASLGRSERRFVVTGSLVATVPLVISRANAGRSAKLPIGSGPSTPIEGLSVLPARRTSNYALRSVANRVGPRTTTGAIVKIKAKRIAAEAIFHCRFHRK